jgi:hypothetical protein
VKKWASIYLKAAQYRLQKQIDGYTFTIEDVYIMQQMCAYEVGFANHLHRQAPMTVIVDRSHRLLQILRSVY